MPISPDIKRVIEILDLRVQSLQKIKQMLLTEFGTEIEGSVVPDIPAETEVQKGEPKKTRKQFLIEFLKKHGPQTRKELMETTGLPRGTIAFLLNDKDTFVHVAGGKWAARQD